MPHERDVVQVVVQMRPAAAVPRVARHSHARPAVFPMARAPQILTTLIGQEHVSPTVALLRAPLQPPAVPCQVARSASSVIRIKTSMSFGLARDVTIDPRRLI